MIGRQEFDKAIAHLRSELRGNASDISSLEMIAHCHHWAGRADEAIKAGREALQCDPKSFDMHALLSQLLVDKGEHEDAAIYARLGLENFLEPLPEIPGFFLKVHRALEYFFPILQGASPDQAIKRSESNRADWYDWAKSYLDWYDATYGDTLGPIKH
jgi:tetratricopeptide (TPR) repeat protein